MHVCVLHLLGCRRLALGSPVGCVTATWENTYEYGVTIQTWGATPPCKSPPSCENKDGSAACCTADCQVLGAGSPIWSLIDPANPSTGGVRARYLGVIASDSNPFWCTFNPATGAQYRRLVDFLFMCDPAVDGAVPYYAKQNASIDCHYEVAFKTSQACARDERGSLVARARAWVAGLFA